MIDVLCDMTCEVESSQSIGTDVHGFLEVFDVTQTVDYNHKLK